MSMVIVGCITSKLVNKKRPVALRSSLIATGEGRKEGRKEGLLVERMGVEPIFQNLHFGAIAFASAGSGHGHHCVPYKRAYVV